MKALLKSERFFWATARVQLYILRTHGSVAVEFALTAPAILLLVSGVMDFGMLATKSAGLTAATRVGAEYARVHPQDAAGIRNVMQDAMSFAPALVFPASFPRSCECNDQAPISCSESCATVGRPGPNRVFIQITGNQSFTPFVPWPGIPATITATTEVRLQ
ncbi:MAG: pilus assembly protein [Alphaproteobacteria bacterium]|nr:pilus assembly protein [Alphaproteobacteria bacterium]